METYDEFKKQYQLPTFEVLDKEFEIAIIEEDSFLLRNIRKKMDERFEIFAKLLEEQLQPEAVLPIIHECRFLDDNDKMVLFDLYKKMMHLVRKAARLAVNNDEKEDVDYINDSLEDWNKMKEPLTKLIKIFEECWSKDVPVEEELRYLG